MSLRCPFCTITDRFQPFFRLWVHCVDCHEREGCSVCDYTSSDIKQHTFEQAEMEENIFSTPDGFIKGIVQCLEDNTFFSSIKHVFAYSLFVDSSKFKSRLLWACSLPQDGSELTKELLRQLVIVSRGSHLNAFTRDILPIKFHADFQAAADILQTEINTYHQKDKEESE